VEVARLARRTAHGRDRRLLAGLPARPRPEAARYAERLAAAAACATRLVVMRTYFEKPPR
jgi:3-deoxy-D-arabino-heptulosonate 7-phosphate (DAHP) synthase